MKNNYRIILGVLLSATLLSPTAMMADAPSTAPAATAATDSGATKTNAPTAKTKKAAKKKAEKKAVAKKSPAAELKTVPLVAGPAVVVASNVNVRGQATLKSEVVKRLTKGDKVTVIEEITRKTGPDEPSAWAKITLPQAAHVWVNTIFLEGTNKTVKPKKLKVRAGPGEEYSVLGILKQGDPVKEMGTKGDWTEIEAPADAYAFMAAQYLKQEAPAAIAANEPPPTPALVTEPPTVTPPTTEPPTPTPAVTNEPPSPTTEPKVDEPPPKRIVQREGYVRGTSSIQAPSRYELISPENHKTMNYLWLPPNTSAKDVDLSRYKGMRIVVTGEEGLDERWRNTPVLTIQKIVVLE
jgi:uncharacterized protein YgiM (DUF1202 family)